MRRTSTLHLRTDLHLARKVWHLATGLTIAMIYSVGLARPAAVLVLSLILGFTVFMETARLKNPLLNQKLVRLWSPFMRSCEVHRMSGVPSYLAACTLAIAVFPKPVALMGILFLAFGDPMASLFGVLYGRFSVRWSNGKTLIGTLAGVGTCVAVALVFLGQLSIHGATAAVIAVVGGVAGGTAELLPLDLDDNFTIPIVSGFAVWLGFILTGLF